MNEQQIELVQASFELVRPIADQVCTVCGEDMGWPEPEAVVPPRVR